MSRKSLIGTTLAVFAAVVGLFAPGHALAATPTGSGPGDALAPVETWTEAAPASTTWYSFTYGGANSQISAWMDVVPANSATFSVWTPEEVQQWANGMAVEPIGRGSVNEFDAGDLSWSGNFNESGTYYLVVENSGSGNSYYTLHVAGDSVSVAAQAAQSAAAPAPTPIAQTAATTASVVKDTGGATPGQAFATPAYAVTITPGASIWHKLQYAGDQSQIQIWLNDKGGSGLSFSVWTPDEVRQMEMGKDVSPIGGGAYDAYAQGDLSWSGNFMQAGTYFVRVSNNSQAAGLYDLFDAGSGVW